MTQVDIYNFYEFVTQEFDEISGKLTLKWDRNNTTLHELMLSESNNLYDRTTFVNLSYVDYIKEHINWKEGDPIYYKVSVNPMMRSKMTIQLIPNAFEEEYTFIELDSYGYLYLREFRGTCMSNKSPTEFDSHKIDCVYNDNTDNEKTLTYVLK